MQVRVQCATCYLLFARLHSTARTYKRASVPIRHVNSRPHGSAQGARIGFKLRPSLSAVISTHHNAHTNKDGHDVGLASMQMHIKRRELNFCVYASVKSRCLCLKCDMSSCVSAAYGRFSFQPFQSAVRRRARREYNRKRERNWKCSGLRDCVNE